MGSPKIVPLLETREQKLLFTFWLLFLDLFALLVIILDFIDFF